MKEVLHVLNGERGLDTYPSVYNALQVFSERGWRSEIATAGPIGEFGDLITKKYSLEGGYFRRAVQLGKISKCFDMVVLYEPRDIEIYELAHIVGGRLTTRCLVHHCLEVPTAVLSRKGIKRIVHQFLYRGYGRINRVVTQDQARHRLLLRYFPFLGDVPTNLVPNSFIPGIEPIAASVPWFDELRSRARWIVCYTGAIERWALSLDLFRAIKPLVGVTFVFSGWSYDGFAREAMEFCHDARHIHFDFGIKSRGEVNYLAANSDLGLVFYDSSDPNVADIGLSSGKLHKFLSFGTPVIANEVPSLKEFLETHGFGASVPVSDLSREIPAMLNETNNYSGRVREDYQKVCDFRSSYRQMLSQIEVEISCSRSRAKVA